MVVCDALLALAGDDVRAAVESFLAGLERSGSLPSPTRVELPDVDDLFETFRTVQAVEAWAVHGEWVRAHQGALGDDIAARFAWASGFGEREAAAARAALRTARASLDAALSGRTLLLPSASSAAPPRDADRAQNEATRAATLRLTCIAGILGAPAVSAPLLRVSGGPVGLCLVGPRGSDLALIDAAAALDAATVL